MTSEYAFWLALWGTVLSTILAFIKIWEIRRDRLRLTTSYFFGTENEIIIENTSPIPALISYWELVWAHRRFGRLFFEHMVDYPDDVGCNIIVPALSPPNV